MNMIYCISNICKAPKGGDGTSAKPFSINIKSTYTIFSVFLDSPHYSLQSTDWFKFNFAKLAFIKRHTFRFF